MDGEDASVFFAKMLNAKNLSHVLKAVHFKGLATVFTMDKGIKVTVEDSKCVQANAFIQKEIFESYNVQDDNTTFCINLDVLQECLTIFGTNPLSSTALTMSYGGYGCPLDLTLEEDSVVTDCSIKTHLPEEILDFEFAVGNVVNNIIMKAECLRDIFQELDIMSEKIKITMSPDEPYFRLTTISELCEAHYDIPNGSDVIEYFKCKEKQINHYNILHLKSSSKALNLASKICIRTDHRGFLSFQYRIKNENDQVCFVEYYFCPETDES